jgi:hypothetical protein
MASKTAASVEAELGAKRQTLREFFSTRKTPDGYAMDEAEIEQSKAMRKEIDELAVLRDGLVEAEESAAENAKSLDAMNAPRNPIPFPAKGGDGATLSGVTTSSGEIFKKELQRASIAEAFIGAYYKHDAKSRNLLFDHEGKPLGQREKDVYAKDFSPIEYKTLFALTAGWASETVRSGRLVSYALRAPMVADLLPTIPVTTGSYKYMEETTFTNNAAEVAEGGTKPEAALALTERTIDVRKIATFLPVTEEQLEDVPGIRAYIESRLALMVELRLDTQLMSGDGVAPNISGFYTQVTQTQAKGADPTFDAIFKAMTKVRTVGFAEPSGIILHPNDWQDVRLTRTTDGIYIMGNPADAGPERLFGVPVVTTTAATENTGLVGDFRTHSALLMRSGMRFKVSDSHSTYFVENKLAILAEIRAGLVVYRPSAFCEVTGI